LIFDTGSDVTWTQCQPCVKSCYQQQEKIFEPSLSTSYKNVSCQAAACAALSSATGKYFWKICVYGIQYGDSSFSVGFFGTEKLSLTSTESLDNFYFGCGQNNQGNFGGAAGLLGLGRDTCYDLTKYKSVTVPRIGFFFGGGAEVDIQSVGILYASKVSQVCLAFAGNGDASDVAIFGNVQQQTIEVVYDGAGERVGFASGGCS
ncbi:Aspartyl protease family protein At5g10770, partial [Linum perenne]